MGVAGEHQADVLAEGVADDLVGVVGGVRHEDDGGVGLRGDRFVEVGATGGGVLDAGDPDALTIAFDGDEAIVEDGGSVLLEDAGDVARADNRIVVAENAEAEGARDLAEGFGAGVDGVFGDVAGMAVGDVVAGDEDEVGGEGVDAVEDVVEEGEFGELVEVNVGDLDDAESVEGVRKVGEGNGEIHDLKVVTSEFSGVQAQGYGGEPGGLKKSAARQVGRGDCRGKRLGWLSRHSVVDESGHRSFYRVWSAGRLGGGALCR